MKIARSVTPMTIVLAFCAALLSVTSTSASARVDEEMTQQQAGREYLDIACNEYDARGLYLSRVWKGRDRIQPAEVRRRLPELRRHAAALSRSESNTARRLFNPPAGWPLDVASEVRTIANQFLRFGNLLGRQGSAYSAGEWLRLNARVIGVVDDLTNMARKLRAKLNLPPPGRGC